MYSKYEKMSVLREILNSYLNVYRLNYEREKEKLKEFLEKNTLTISDKSVQSALSTIVGWLRDSAESYEELSEVLVELKKALLCFEVDYTKENIQSELADEREKEGNKLYFELKTKNQKYKKIMANSAMDLWRNDCYLQGLGLDYNVGIKKLEDYYINGKFSKRDFIYYEIMYESLLNNSQYIEDMQQFSNSDLKDSKKGKYY